MITITAFIIILSIVIRAIVTKTGIDRFMICIIVPFFGAIITVMICLLCITFGGKFEEIKRISYSDKIYSLRNTEGINGSFILGSGFVSSAEYYYTFRKDNRGGYYRDKLWSGNVVIFQQDNIEPNMSWQVIHYKLPKWIHYWPEFTTGEQDTKVDLVVPKNTIIEEFKVK